MKASVLRRGDDTHTAASGAKAREIRMVIGGVGNPALPWRAGAGDAAIMMPTELRNVEDGASRATAPRLRIDPASPLP